MNTLNIVDCFGVLQLKIVISGFLWVINNRFWVIIFLVFLYAHVVLGLIFMNMQYSSNKTIQLKKPSGHLCVNYGKCFLPLASLVWAGSCVLSAVVEAMILQELSRELGEEIWASEEPGLAIYTPGLHLGYMTTCSKPSCPKYVLLGFCFSKNKQIINYRINIFPILCWA